MPLASVQLPADVPPPSEVSIGGEKLLDLGFATLSTFPYNIVDAGSGASKAEIEAAAKIDQIPKWAHAFDGRKIVLTGYMMPVQVEGGRAKKFVMMKDIMTCCYGAVPKMNDYVVVEMKGDGVEAIQDIPVQVVGVMHISEKREDGYVVSLFEMDGEKFLGVKK
jgi:hypothetical protein